MDCGRFTNDAELSTALVVACDEPTGAVGNSERTRNIILGRVFHAQQIGIVELIGRGVRKT